MELSLAWVPLQLILIQGETAPVDCSTTSPPGPPDVPVTDERVGIPTIVEPPCLEALSNSSFGTASPMYVP